MINEVVEFAFEFAREEYNRTAARLALLETKCQLTAAVAAILIAVLPTVWDANAGSIGTAALCGLSAVSLLTSLFSAIKGSLVVDVDSPKAAEQVAIEVADYLVKNGAAGDSSALWNEAGASYRVATGELKRLAASRARALLVSQIALVFAFLLTLMLVLNRWGSAFLHYFVQGSP